MSEKEKKELQDKLKVLQEENKKLKEEKEKETSEEDKKLQESILKLEEENKKLKEEKEKDSKKLNELEEAHKKYIENLTTFTTKKEPDPKSSENLSIEEQYDQINQEIEKMKNPNKEGEN